MNAMRATALDTADCDADGPPRSRAARAGNPILARSCGMLVFVDEAAETIAPPDVEPGELVRVGDLLGEWLQGSSVRDTPMGR